MPSYHRHGHLKTAPLVKNGDWVKRGQLIGYVGTSGASSGPHLHYDVFSCSAEVVKALGGFTFYVYGWSLQRVKSLFIDPTPFIAGGIPAEWSLPMNGYHFLERVNDVKHGVYYHPGEDVNGLNDYGKPVYSPVDGRVVYVQAPTDRIWNKLFGWLAWGKGWGNMVVIEQAPDAPKPTTSKLTTAQIEQLNRASARINAGVGSLMDIENVKYATEKMGYVAPK